MESLTRGLRHASRLASWGAKRSFPLLSSTLNLSVDAHAACLSLCHVACCRQRIDSKAMSVVGKLPVAPFESVRDFKACESTAKG